MKAACGLAALLSFLYATSTLPAQEPAKPAQDVDARPPVELTDEARQLHASSIVIDGHNDLPWEIRTKGSFSFNKLDIAQRLPMLQTDIPRLREGGVGAQFWSVWVPVETSLRGESLHTTLEEIDLVHAMIDRYPETFELALTADDIVRIHASGKIASLIGVAITASRIRSRSCGNFTSSAPGT